MHAALVGVVGLASAGCGGATAETPAASGDGGVISTSDGLLPDYAAADVMAAAAACGATDSTFVAYDSAAEMKSLLEGSWYYCGQGSSKPLPAGAAGAQFTAAGEFRWLVVDPSGALTSGVSPVNLNAPSFVFTPATSVPASEDADGARIAYDFGSFSAGHYTSYGGEVDLLYADRSSMPLLATFEASPHRMYLDDWDFPFVYVGP